MGRFNKRIEKYIRQTNSLPEKFYIYRALKVVFSDFFHELERNKYVGSYDGIGSSWTYDIKYAIPYLKFSGKEEMIIVAAKIDKSLVNWKESISLEKANVNLEKLIYLDRSTPIVIERILRCSKNQLISTNFKVKA